MRIQISWLPRAGGIAGFVAIVGGMVAGVGPSQAVPAPGTWGYQGMVSTDSTLTVRWDNFGNPADSIVPRDETQELLHTASKSYADVGPSMQNKYAAQFGADNGQGGLQMTVSQTTGLVNQAIQLTFTGGPTNTSQMQAENKYLQIFQCWGAPGADGKPNQHATSPDPATCQLGTAGIGSNGDPLVGGRNLLQDPLLAGGDWKEFEGPTAQAVPVLGIDGKTAPGDAPHNTFFSSTTTNEIDSLAFDANGKAQTVFEVQTGAEAAFLGCGFSKISPTTSNCWLVAVPRTPDLNINAHPAAWGSALKPSVWAQRMQVKLGFRDAPGVCSGSDARTLAAGSELMGSAMTSWIPALCTGKKLAAGFTKLSDAQARAQQVSGRQPMVFTTEPVPGSLHAPAALAGVSVAFNIGMSAEDRSGKYLGLLPQLKLNARLVAKLLTQSYTGGMVLDANGDAGAIFDADVPWAKDFPSSILYDPEFVKLNPGIAALIVKSDRDGSNIQLESLRSDAAERVWQWIQSDPAGRSFLNGCPDDAGHVINPFYSTRSYQGCEGQATALEATAKVRRDQTVKPATFTDGAQQFPPASTSYPLPGWYESIPILRNSMGPILGPDGKPQKDPEKLSLGMTDIYPRQDSMFQTARNAFRGVNPSYSEWCSRSTGCVPPNFPLAGKWVSPGSVPPEPRNRFSIAITDTATAALYQLPTAQLCSTDGSSCVGADTQSLLKEATRFQAPDKDGAQAKASTADYASGAYPLTLPVYAAVQVKGLAPADAGAYATMLDYVSTTGQVPGTGTGQLPPGYAPLPSAMKAQTAVVVGLLRELSVPVAPTQTPNSIPLAPGGNLITGLDVAQLPGQQPAAGSIPATNPAPAKQGAGKAAPVAGSQPVNATEKTDYGFAQYSLLFALGFGLLAALASPLLGRIGRHNGAGQ